MQQLYQLNGQKSLLNLQINFKYISKQNTLRCLSANVIKTKLRQEIPHPRF